MSLQERFLRNTVFIPLIYQTSKFSRRERQFIGRVGSCDCDKDSPNALGVRFYPFAIKCSSHALLFWPAFLFLSKAVKVGHKIFPLWLSIHGSCAVCVRVTVARSFHKLEMCSIVHVQMWETSRGISKESWEFLYAVGYPYRLRGQERIIKHF